MVKLKNTTCVKTVNEKLQLVKKGFTFKVKLSPCSASVSILGTLKNEPYPSLRQMIPSSDDWLRLDLCKKNGKNSSPVCYSANNQDDDDVDDDDSDCKAIIFIEEYYVKKIILVLCYLFCSRSSS